MSKSKPQLSSTYTRKIKEFIKKYKHNSDKYVGIIYALAYLKEEAERSSMDDISEIIEGTFLICSNVYVHLLREKYMNPDNDFFEEHI